ncbi:SDR family NAD(P)-dependent oxidoreductase [Pseudomonas sp. RC10]|uniref:SDR family oxidoreductase n=1 Tax=Pseudomonas bambusae TaxID=3139142 RepID=UPI00313966C3
MKTAFVTGVSQGFGKAMAEKLLSEGFRVFGCSRTAPEGLQAHERFHWAAVDLSQLRSVELLVCSMLEGHGRIEFDLVFLNAGRFGPPPRPATEVLRDEFVDVLNLNLLANKVLLDLLLKEHGIAQCVFSASIAGVRMRAGMLSYSVSKAALNALAQIYALEHPSTFFAVLGLCNLHTQLLRDALAGEYVDSFSEVAALRERARDERYLALPSLRAEQVWGLYQVGFDRCLTSGVFQDIRGVLLRG